MSIEVRFTTTKYGHGTQGLKVFKLLSQQQRVNKRGLASASEETKERVAKAGGDAPHSKRGLQTASPEIRQEVARKGGLARGEQRRKAHDEGITGR